MARLIKRPQQIWDRSLDEQLRSLVVEDGKTPSECARELNKDPDLIRKQLKRLKLLHISSNRKVGSKGQRELERIVREIFPNDIVKSEQHLYDRLFLDVWVPQRKLGFEYQGRQHDEIISFFHSDKEAFKRQLERDHKKRKLCEQNGITLICVHWKEELSKDYIYERIIKAIQDESE